MKTHFKNFKTTLFLSVFMLISSNLLAQDSKRGKNTLEIGAGISMPNFSSTPDGQAYAGSGSNISFSYEREIISKKNEWLTLGARYLTTSNPYSHLNEDIALFQNTNPTLSFTGTSDNYKLSSFLLGCGFYNYIGKKENFTLFIKAYLGTGGLTSPAQSIKASNEAYVNISEITKNSFVYTGSAGINYNFTKKIALGVNFEYIKGSFLFVNQNVSLVNGTTSQDPYTINYSNLCLSTALSFKF
jgi:opacity protein-like surface antigen